MQVDSNSTSSGHKKKEEQGKEIIVTGEMGIILPRIGQAYGTIKDKKSRKIYNIYGKDLNLHTHLMEKLHTMYDVNKWPVHIKAVGILQSPDFIDIDSENILTITDVDQVEQVEGSIR